MTKQTPRGGGLTRGIEEKHHIGEEVRKLREERGWKQAQLAVYADLSHSALSQIESGQRNPNFDSVVRLADALGVEVVDLVARAYPPKADALQGSEQGTQDTLGGWISYARTRTQAWRVAGADEDSPFFKDWQTAAAFDAYVSEEASQLMHVLDVELFEAVVPKDQPLTAEETEYMEMLQDAVSDIMAASLVVTRRSNALVASMATAMRDTKKISKARR